MRLRGPLNPEWNALFTPCRGLVVRVWMMLQKLSPELRTVLPNVQNFETRVAMEMHNSFEKQDSIQGDAIYSELSLDTSPIYKQPCLLTVSV
jgi:hypothetical protein